MTALPSPQRPPNEPNPLGRITVSMRGESPRPVEEADGPVSPWLYLAGLLVTLSALYAVNFGLEDAGFALLTYFLATGGYVVSYLLRVRGVSLRGMQVPMLTLLGFFFLLSLLFGQGALASDAPSRNLQIALTWVAILHSYTLNNNGAVLFACVPGMTMIALVSTSTTEVEAQNAFLVFCCASTFLMVHENYLRTQAYLAKRRGGDSRPALFGGQLLLAVGCFIGAILLARVTAVPMQFFGERLFPQGTLSAIHNAIKQNVPGANGGNTERTNYELATGPITATESPVMEVKADQGLYWRTQTFDLYTGHSFKNNLRLEPIVDDTTKNKRADRLEQGFFDPNNDPPNHYDLSPGTVDLPESDMSGARMVQQHFKVLTAGISQLSGAARVKSLETKANSLNTDGAGGLVSKIPLMVNDEYDVTSIVPTEDDKLLRTASARDIPADIKEIYLQTPDTNAPEIAKLANLAAEWTNGLPNNYDKVKAIQQHIALLCKYSLDVPSAPRNRDTVEYFLFESKKGYCDSFGATLTMMCRYANIPARMVTGFLPGDPTAQPNLFLVKDKHRHIWTEVFFAHIGWVKFDATEGAEDITPKNENQQKKAKSLVAWLVAQGIGPKLIGLALLFMVGYLVKTELLDRMRLGGRSAEARAIARPPGNIAILEAYGAALKLLARRGLTRAGNRTPVEFVAAVQARLAGVAPTVGPALAQLTELHDRFCYSSETASPQEVQQANASLRQLREALNGWKGEAPRPDLPAGTAQA